MKKNFSNVFKDLRKQREMTQEQIAEELGVSCQAISKWERADAVPDAFVLKKIAAVFNVTVDYPWRHAAESDDVCDTLNYAVLANIIKQEMAAPSNLLEHVAMRIANSVKAKFALTSAISIDIRKIAPPVSHVTEGCGVTLKMRY